MQMEVSTLTHGNGKGDLASLTQAKTTWERERDCTWAAGLQWVKDPSSHCRTASVT